MRPDTVQFIYFIKYEFLKDIYIEIKEIISFICNENKNFISTLNKDIIKEANLSKLIIPNLIFEMEYFPDPTGSRSEIIEVFLYEPKNIETLKISVKKILSNFKNLYAYDPQWPKTFNFSLDFENSEKKISDRIKTVIKKSIVSAKKKIQRKLKSEIIKEINEVKNKWQTNVKNFDINDIIINTEGIIV